MTTLQEAIAPSGRAARLVERVADRLSRLPGVSRRGFLVQSAVVGSAVVLDPWGYVLKPGTAYASVCGPSSSCAAGYTVFCCTINKGVNSCPPGTFAAGWWKAADSSWCCGGYRYIVDCNAACSGCTSGCGGDHICDKGCWSCSCKCGPSTTCDQRRVCCNAFRYGQCNTHVSCSGGVACRVVSCVAPYKWENCTTTSLVDNNTAEHNAPCLQGCGPILTKYDALGGPGSSLGMSKGPEKTCADGSGRAVDYQGGAIYWSSATGAHTISGAIRSKWAAIGSVRSSIGYPTADPTATAGDNGRGRCQAFQRGAIYWTSTTGAHTLTGAIRSKWSAIGSVRSSIGYPTSDAMKTTADGGRGLCQAFERGAIYWTSATGAHTVEGALRTKWTQIGSVTSRIGYPTTDQMSGSGGGLKQKFEHGSIASRSDVGTHYVPAAIDAFWAAHGREGGTYGYPVADPVAASGGGESQRFQGGTITVAADGTVSG